MRAPLLAALLLFAPALAHAQEPARWAVTAAEPTTLRLVPPAGAAVTLYDGAVPVARVDRPAALRLATGRTYQVVAHRPGGVVASFALRADGGVIVLGWSADDTLELRSLHRTTAGSVAAPPPAPRRHVRLHAPPRPLAPASVGALVAALAAGSPRVLCTVPAGDERTASALEAIGAVAARRSASAAPCAAGPASRGALARLRDHLFSPEAPPAAEVGEGVTFFSAPGEGRECVEIARRIQEEAARGVALDDIALLVP